MKFYLRTTGCPRHVGSHSVTCHPTQVNTPRSNSNQRPVINLPTSEGWKAELTQVTGYTPRQFTRTQSSRNLAVHGRESNSRPVNHKSDALNGTPPSHPRKPVYKLNKKLSYRRETARQLPTSKGRGLDLPVHSPSSGYTYSYAYGRIRKPQRTYVKRAVRNAHFNMNRAFKIIQGHPYWCRQESRIV